METNFMFSSYWAYIDFIEDYSLDDYMSLKREELPIIFQRPTNQDSLSWKETMSKARYSIKYKYTNPKLVEMFTVCGFNYRRFNCMYLYNDYVSLKVFHGIIWDESSSKLLAVGSSNKVTRKDEKLWLNSLLFTAETYVKMKGAVTALMAQANRRGVEIIITPNLLPKFTDCVEQPVFEDFEEEIDYYDTLLQSLKGEILVTRN